MSKRYRYSEVPGTMKNLFTRRLANDEVNKTAEWADHIIELVRNELSEQDLATTQEAARRRRRGRRRADQGR